MNVSWPPTRSLHTPHSTATSPSSLSRIWTIRRGSGKRCCRLGGLRLAVWVYRGQPAVGLHALPLWHLQLHAGAARRTCVDSVSFQMVCVGGSHLALSSGQF